MESTNNQFKVLFSSKLWDDDAWGLAEYKGEKVYFLILHDYIPVQQSTSELIPIYPVETIPIIEQHKLDVLQMGDEYYKKYSNDPWIGATQDYNISYDNDGAIYGYYQVRQLFYYFYRMPRETVSKLENYWSGGVWLSSESLREILDIKNYELIGKFRPSELIK